MATLYFKVAEEVIAIDGFVDELEVEELDGEDIEGALDIIGGHDEGGAEPPLLESLAEGRKELDEAEVHLLQDNYRVDIRGLLIEVRGEGAPDDGKGVDVPGVAASEQFVEEGGCLGGYR